MDSTVVLVDDEFRHTHVAGELFDRTDQPLEEIYGTHVEAVFPPEPAETLRDHYRNAFEGVTETFRLDCWGRQFRVRTAPTRNETGEITAAMGLFVDRSEWQWYADTLEILRRQLYELLGAETETALFRTLVEITTASSPLSSVTVYRFDEENATLHPEATEGTEGDVEAVDPGDHLVWEAFKREIAVFDDEIHPAVGSPTDDSEGYRFALPFGDNGVIEACSTDETFDPETTAETVRLLCSITEKLLDRIRYREQLRQDDLKRQRRGRKLERSERALQTFSRVVRTAISVETLEALETGVCETLVEHDDVEFAWLGTLDRSNGTIRLRSCSGTGNGYLDRLPIELEAADEPTARAALDREVTVIDDLAAEIDAETWRIRGLERGFRSVIAIPLSHNGISHGVLTLYADRPNVFEDITSIAADLGAIVGYASTAIQRQNALLTQASTELEVEIISPACFFVRFVQETQSSVSFESISTNEEGLPLVYVTAEDSASLLEYAERSIQVDSARRLDGDGDVLEVQFDDSFIGSVLSAHGIALESASATPEKVRITVSIPPTMSPRDALDVIRTEYPDSSLLAKRDARRDTEQSRPESVFDQLTDRQREIVERAYREGYFETPKETTGEQLAAEMDISTSAFHNHLRAAESELFAWLFDRPEE